MEERFSSSEPIGRIQGPEKEGGLGDSEMDRHAAQEKESILSHLKSILRPERPSTPAGELERVKENARADRAVKEPSKEGFKWGLGKVDTKASNDFSSRYFGLGYKDGRPNYGSVADLEIRKKLVELRERFMPGGYASKMIFEAERSKLQKNLGYMDSKDHLAAKKFLQEIKDKGM